MGTNNFVALSVIPAGTPQETESAPFDLYALVPPNGFSPTGFSVILSGNFTGSVALTGSLDGVNYRPLVGFTAGSRADMTSDDALEFEPQLVTSLVRYIKWRTQSVTQVFSPVKITLGGELNCDCAGGGGGLTTIYEVDLTAQPNQALVNGTQSIAGKSWLIENRAAASVFEIQNGVGMVITSDGPNDIAAGVRTAPIAIFSLFQMTGGLQPFTQYGAFRLWLSGTNTPTTDNNRCDLAIANMAFGAVPTTFYNTWGLSVIYEAGVVTSYPKLDVNDAFSIGPGFGVNLAVTCLVWKSPREVEVYVGFETTPGEFPDFDTLIFMGTVGNETPILSRDDVGAVGLQASAVASALDIGTGCTLVLARLKLEIEEVV